jgi:hypothetical protein
VAGDGLKATIYVHGQFGDMRADLLRIRKELNFSQVVLDGINAIQKFQRMLAPIGHTGRGPHGNIPRKILPARVYQRGDGSAWAWSRTSYGPAIFTSEGTGQFGPRNRPYFVARENEETGSRGYFHPGQRATHWWERGANMGSPFALASFERKVKHALRVR